MGIVTDLLAWLTQQTQPYNREASFMLVATLLVIYGDIINRHIKRALAPYHFLIRTLAFVLICAFGYGAFTLFIAPKMLILLSYLPSLYQGICILLAFVLVGVLAEKRRYL